MGGLSPQVLVLGSLDHPKQGLVWLTGTFLRQDGMGSQASDGHRWVRSTEAS